MDTTTLLLLVVAAAIGAFGAASLTRRSAEARLGAMAAERDAARLIADAAAERASLAEADVSGLRTALDYEKRAAAERVALVERSQERLGQSFEALSARAKFLK